MACLPSLVLGASLGWSPRVVIASYESYKKKNTWKWPALTPLRGAPPAPSCSHEGKSIAGEVAAEWGIFLL